MLIEPARQRIEISLNDPRFPTWFESALTMQNIEIDGRRWQAIEYCELLPDTVQEDTPRMAAFVFIEQHDV